MRIIAGSARGRRLDPPPDRSTRPPLDRVKEAVFSLLDDYVEGSRVLDLFAGVGSFGLEALSRGARHATFVELGSKILDPLAANIDKLGFRAQSQVLAVDALREPSVEDPAHRYGLVFLDPPFPFFKQDAKLAQTLARVEELRTGPLTAPGALLVLRTPSFYRAPAPTAAIEDRHYGQSRIIVLEKGPPG